MASLFAWTFCNTGTGSDKRLLHKYREIGERGNCKTTRNISGFVISWCKRCWLIWLYFFLRWYSIYGCLISGLEAGWHQDRLIVKWMVDFAKVGFSRRVPNQENMGKSCFFQWFQGVPTGAICKEKSAKKCRFYDLGSLAIPSGQNDSFSFQTSGL